MNTDIRVAVGFLDHRKTLRLQRAHGPQAVLSLLRLWLWCATHRPDGDLAELADDAIDAEARWPGCTAALVEHGWIDGDPLERRVHDWEAHNGYATGASRRSETARENASKRWRKDANECRRMMPPHKRAHMPPHDAPSPSPSPSPSPPEASAPLVAEIVENALPQPSSCATPRRRRTLARGSTEYSFGFVQAWNAYPHFGTRSRKPLAAKLWQDLGLEAQSDQVLDWIEWARTTEDWLREGGQYVQAFQVWLRDRDFTDAPPATRIANPASLLNPKTRRGEDAFDLVFAARRKRREEGTL